MRKPEKKISSVTLFGMTKIVNKKQIVNFLLDVQALGNVAGGLCGGLSDRSKAPKSSGYQLGQSDQTERCKSL